MGLLIHGEPFNWSDMKQYREYVKKHGVAQFLNVFRQHKDRSTDRFFWGDEIECVVLNVDHEKRTAKIALRGHEILDKLVANQEAAEEKEPGSAWNAIFHPEYGNFMVEVTPGAPYGSYSSDLRVVEKNMRLRRCLIQTQLNPGEMIVSLSNYPLLGVGEYSVPFYPNYGKVLKSAYVADQIMSPHPRFAALSGNIRRRRGKRVNITMPLYKDKNTTSTTAGNVIPIEEHPDLMPTCDQIHMDAMGFGMGCCCLQVTFQTRSIQEARHLYDQLAVISPIFLALTASTPMHRGLIADTDARWDVISQAVDDRTELERGISLRSDGVVAGDIFNSDTDLLDLQKKNKLLQNIDVSKLSSDAKTSHEILNTVVPSPVLSPVISPAVDNSEISLLSLCPTDCNTENNSNSAASNPVYSNDAIVCSDGQPLDSHPTVGLSSPSSPHRLYKSRYSSIDCYISNDEHYRDVYNDLPFPYDTTTYNTLRNEGVDCLLSKHLASLFTRDPLVIFQGKVEVDDSQTTEHFESIQSTNWRSVRFKPPPLNSEIGWRVEFRTMEIQLSDFENAAYTVFIALLSRAISFFNLNLYIPLSLVDENFVTAHKNNASAADKFYFRRTVRSCKLKPNTNTDTNTNTNSSQRHCWETVSDKAFEAPNAASEVCTMVDSMTMGEIFCGKTYTNTGSHTNSTYPGLIPIVRAYLDITNCDIQTRIVVNRYLDYITDKACNKLKTTAQCMRDWIYSHPSYKQDSVVSEEILYDLALLSDRIGKGLLSVGELTGGHDVASNPDALFVEKVDWTDKDFYEYLRLSYKHDGTNKANCSPCAKIMDMKAQGDHTMTLTQATNRLKNSFSDDGTLMAGKITDYSLDDPNNPHSPVVSDTDRDSGVNSIFSPGSVIDKLSSANPSAVSSPSTQRDGFEIDVANGDLLNLQIPNTNSNTNTNTNTNINSVTSLLSPFRSPMPVLGSPSIQRVLSNTMCTHDECGVDYQEFQEFYVSSPITDALTEPTSEIVNHNIV